MPLLPLRNNFHSTQNPRGFLAWLSGDNRRAKVHKEIGSMLEDYDDKLTRLYDETVEAVIASPACAQLMIVYESIHNGRSN